MLGLANDIALADEGSASEKLLVRQFDQLFAKNRRRKDQNHHSSPLYGSNIACFSHMGLKFSFHIDRLARDQTPTVVDFELVQKVFLEEEGEWGRIMSRARIHFDENCLIAEEEYIMREVFDPSAEESSPLLQRVNQIIAPCFGAKQPLVPAPTMPDEL